MTKLLIIGYVWPEPNSSAAGSRMMQLIECFLSQQWDITFASPAAESEHRYPFESLDVKKENIKVNSHCFDDFITTLSPDIVLFDRFLMEEQFGWRVEKFCPQAVRLIETVDLHCLREARHIALKKNIPFKKQDLFNEIAKREIASILRCDLSLMISSIEMDYLTTVFKIDTSLLLHLPFMLKTIDDSDKDNIPSYLQRTNFISIGNFRHAPNWDAVLYLKQSIWPLIHKALPQAKMHIYGSYPPPKANQLHNEKQNFHILGWAKNVEEVMKSSRVCLAPLRFGAGLKGKLLDAMQFGTPSVTTDIGAEGMHNELNWNGTIANTPNDIADAAVELYNDSTLWKTSQDNGYSLINSLYDNDIHSKIFLNRIDNILNNLDEHRLNNFTGSMLRHHTMKSTQYMAQWIEAKNKK